MDFHYCIIIIIVYDDLPFLKLVVFTMLLEFVWVFLCLLLVLHVKIVSAPDVPHPQYCVQRFRHVRNNLVMLKHNLR
jgi:hypothetical protein